MDVDAEPTVAEILPLSLARSLSAHAGPVYSLRFTRDKTYMLSGGHDASLCLWNPSSGMLVKKYPGIHNYEVLAIDIADDKSRFFSAGGEKHAFCVDVTTGRVVRKFTGHERKINALTLLRGGPAEQGGAGEAGLSATASDQLVVTASSDRSVRFWDLRSGGGGRGGGAGRGAAVQVVQDARDSVMSLAVSKDCCEILTGSMDGCLRRYDIRKGQVTVDDVQDPVSRVSFSGDGNCLLCSTLTSKIHLLDKDSGDILQTYRGHTNTKYVIDSALDPSDAYVVSGSEDGKFIAWELVEGEMETKLLPEDGSLGQNVVLSLAFRDEGMMVCGGSNGLIRIFERLKQAGPMAVPAKRPRR